MKSLYQSYFEMGFIPGPSESEESFFSRIEMVQKIINTPNEFIKDKLFSKGKLAPFYKCGLIYSPKRFNPLFASQTYIIETDNGTILPVVNEPSKLSSLFLPKSQVIEHELIHARRALFNDEKFEEIIAYRTGSSFFRRYFSPLFTSSSQVILFTCSLLIPPLAGLILTFYMGRLIIKQRRITRCIDYLKSKTAKYEDVLPFLTDDEIVHISKGQMNLIDKSLFRWRFIETLFGKI